MTAAHSDAGRTAFDSPGRGFGSVVVRLSDIVLARAKVALAPFELTPLGYDAMVCILEGDGLSQQELSRKLNMYAAKIVPLIDGLETRSLVERQVSPVDRRRHQLRLTANGVALLKRAAVVALALDQELFGAVPDREKAHITSLVERLERSGEDVRPKPGGTGS